MSSAETFIEQSIHWAAGQSQITALALVGSRARGTARPDSDVDLILLTAEPQTYQDDRRWLDVFGDVERVTEEDWGRVRSLRVVYRHGLEVEFGFSTPDWAQAAPVDPGTARVVRAGMRSLYDPAGVLQSLQAAVDRGADREESPD